MDPTTPSCTPNVTTLKVTLLVTISTPQTAHQLTETVSKKTNLVTPRNHKPNPLTVNPPPLLNNQPIANQPLNHVLTAHPNKLDLLIPNPPRKRPRLNSFPMGKHHPKDVLYQWAFPFNKPLVGPHNKVIKVPGRPPFPLTPDIRHKVAYDTTMTNIKI